MKLYLYDTYHRSRREFIPLRPDWVGLYTCGPTVYDYAHLGNLRTYLFEDGLKRVLTYNGHQVRHVMNVTDVGHLVSDADEGEDKMEKGSRRTGKTAWQIAEEYTQAFQADIATLNILAPTIWCKATDHIQEQIAFIRDLEAQDFTYQTKDGVYFDTSKQADYGYLARLDKAGLQAGHRVELGGKKHLTDFALWKLSPIDEQRQMEWESPWGKGFPGWHIECSAMAQQYLGDYFDIHCGGEDHIAVHHTNEIAQTEARCGTRLANYWLHGYFLQLNQVKMAKADGGFLRVQTLLDQGYDPLAYRYLCLTAHYRSQMNFTWDALEAAQVGLNRLRQSFWEFSQSAGSSDEHPVEGTAGIRKDNLSYQQRFLEAVNDDLNFPRALAVVWELVRSELSNAEKRVTLVQFDDCLGLGLAAWRPPIIDIPPEVQLWADSRHAARQAKDWAEADRLRKLIQAAGYVMEDTAEGFRVRLI